jgi:hypothetical protein
MAAPMMALAIAISVGRAHVRQRGHDRRAVGADRERRQT